MITPAEVVTGYTVLERAGLITAAEAATETAQTAPARDLHALAADLARILTETEAEFTRLPIFVRPLARSGFKAKSGKSFMDWRRTAEQLAQNRAANPDLPRQLQKLLAYYQGVPAETARFTKDPATLRQITDISKARVQLIETLITALTP